MAGSVNIFMNRADEGKEFDKHYHLGVPEFSVLLS